MGKTTKSGDRFNFAVKCWIHVQTQLRIINSDHGFFDHAKFFIHSGFILYFLKFSLHFGRLQLATSSVCLLLCLKSRQEAFFSILHVLVSEHQRGEILVYIKNHFFQLARDRLYLYCAPSRSIQIREVLFILG